VVVCIRRVAHCSRRRVRSRSEMRTKACSSIGVGGWVRIKGRELVDFGRDIQYKQKSFGLVWQSFARFRVEIDPAMKDET